MQKKYRFIRSILLQDRMPRSHRVSGSSKRLQCRNPAPWPASGRRKQQLRRNQCGHPRRSGWWSDCCLEQREVGISYFYNISTFHTLDFCLDIVYLDFDGLWINCDIFWYFHENLWWYDILMFFFREIETKSGLEFGFPLHLWRQHLLLWSLGTWLASHPRLQLARLLEQQFTPPRAVDGGDGAYEGIGEWLDNEAVQQWLQTAGLRVTQWKAANKKAAVLVMLLREEIWMEEIWLTTWDV